MDETSPISGAPDLSAIEKVPWMELDHAYGSAIDVPGQLRSLLSPDAQTRRRALFGFYSNLFHQGSVYSATVAAIPVFQQLLRYEQVAEKPRILELLASFAVGFTEDVLENVDLAEFLGAGDENNACEVDSIRRECYLAVGAGVPLYERLLDDGDPRVAISSAFALAFFPAHAFGSVRALLAVARDEGRHEFVRGLALIAASYLGGGAAREELAQTLRAAIEDEESSSEEPLLWLAATAVYCLLREKRGDVDPELCRRAESLAVRCLEKGIEAPECSFYPPPETDPVDLATVDAEALLMPDPQFPWGDLAQRIRRHTNYRPQVEQKRRVVRQPGPDPQSFDVKPGVFDSENVVAAVLRMHAYFWGLRQSVPIGEFEPFKPHAMLAWDVIAPLLDSDTPEDRWAAARVIELFGPLEESAIDELLERLPRGDNNDLGSLILKQPVNEWQCQELCEKLIRRDYEVSQYHSPRDDYRGIVVEHGTTDQLRRLFHEGEFKERAAAAQELSSRGEMEPEELLPVLAEALVSDDYGLAMSAKWTFAQWPTAHRWFLGTYESIPPTQRWAIAEAMSGFGADPTEQQDALFSQIEAEENQVLAAKLVGVLSRLPTPDAAAVDRLVDLSDKYSSPALLRCAVVRALGEWIGKGLDDLLGERLRDFAADPSSRVRARPHWMNCQSWSNSRNKTFACCDGP